MGKEKCMQRREKERKACGKKMKGSGEKGESWREGEKIAKEGGIKTNNMKNPVI
jgi:hypothetical protein